MGSIHGNVDTLNHNLISPTTKDEDFVNEIQNITWILKEMGIQTLIGRRCLNHNEMVTYKSEISQIDMVEFEE
jgi:hypothetical protein